MKYLFVVAFLALVAVTLAGPLPEAPASTQNENPVETVKTEDAKDNRDKRGLLVTSYATAPISAPIAYPAPAPVLPAVSYVQAYPSTYIAGFPHSPITYVL